MQSAEEIHKIKQAQTEHAIHPLLAQRWSPRAFSEQLIDRQTIGSLFEAARWAPSGGNGQPWAFIIASRENPEEFERLLACISPFNAEWAKDAALLGIAVAQTTRDDGKPSPLAPFDLGLAMQNLLIQATSHGVYLHILGGFSSDQARATYAIPETHTPCCAFVAGYFGNPENLSERVRERELAPRARKPLAGFVFGNEWGKTSSLLSK